MITDVYYNSLMTSYMEYFISRYTHIMEEYELISRDAVLFTVHWFDYVDLLHLYMRNVKYKNNNTH